MNWFDDNKVTCTFQWLNGERAKRITAIAKQYGARFQRLAQERNALGYCKVVVTFDKHPGWAPNNETCGKFKTQVINDGLTNSLTF